MSASGSGDGHPAMAPPGIDSDGEMPGLIVFDLDYTLWPCWVDTHVDPPFEQQTRHASESGDGDRLTAVDANGTLMSVYDDVVDILEWASGKSKLAAASRTHAPPAAVELMACLEIDHFFTFSEIYPSSKLKVGRQLGGGGGVRISVQRLRVPISFPSFVFWRGEGGGGWLILARAVESRAVVDLPTTCDAQHFRALKADSGLDYADMIFFDDETRNIREVRGVLPPSGSPS